MPKPQLIETRDRYGVFRSLTTRWIDNDVFGHINNAVYNAWMDTAVTDFFRHAEPALDSAVIPVAAETMFTFHRSISHPAKVETGFRAEMVGNRSVRCGVAVFEEGHAEASAWGHMVHVWVERSSLQAVPIPVGVRRGLESVMINDEGKQP